VGAPGQQRLADIDLCLATARTPSLGHQGALGRVLVKVGNLAETGHSPVQDGRQHSNQTGHQIAEVDSREADAGECSRSRDTSAASRCMNSSGDISRCAVPSRKGVLNFWTT
jgi:hypothetical protein